MKAKKSKFLGVKLTTKEKQSLKKLADRSGVGVSAFIRVLIKHEMERQSA